MINYLKKIYWTYINLSKPDTAMFIFFPIMGLSLILLPIYSIINFDSNKSSIWTILICSILGISFLGLSIIYRKNRK
jgi:hypothetical protein